MKKLATSLVAAAFLFAVNINAQEVKKETKAKKAKTEKAACSTAEKKACSVAGEKKGSCCAAKKA